MQVTYRLYTPTFAATYNCGSYGAGAYDSSGQCATVVSGGSAGQSGGGSTMLNTGVTIVLPILVGVALIVAAVLTVRRKKNSRK